MQYRKLQHSHCCMQINNEVIGYTRLQHRSSNLTEVEIAKPREITEDSIHLTLNRPRGGGGGADSASSRFFLNNF